MGLVHRDISTGNVMWLDGIGKLSDLEYCMEYERGEQTLHNELTVRKSDQSFPAHQEDYQGTPYFLSAEVLSHNYLYWPGDSENVGFWGRRSGQEAIFVTNYIHDAESLWWLLIYFILSTRPVGETNIPPEQVKERIAVYEKFFPTYDFISTRKNVNENPFHSRNLFRALFVKEPYPKQYTSLLEFAFDSFRTKIVNVYRKAEEVNLKFDPSPMVGLHQEIEVLLSGMLRSAKSAGEFVFLKNHNRRVK